MLMDLRMPEMDGVDRHRRAPRHAPAVRVLVLTTFDTDADVLPAVEAGATGYLLKDAPRGGAGPGGAGRAPAARRCWRPSRGGRS